MTFPPIYSLVLSFFPCLIPPYALRLSRVFGTRRVGWVVFSVFSVLAVLQVVRAWQPFGLGLDAGLTLDLLNFLVPVLLLISMIHIEMLFKERLRVEQEEKRLRDRLEFEVQERTADLDRANDALQTEISLRKQGEQELRKSKEQYRFLFDENPQPMWIYDLESLRLLAFNSATLRHYGFSRTEFRDKSIKDLCLPSDMDVVVADSAKPSPEVQRRGLWRHCKKDGSLIEVEITALDLSYAGCAARLILAHDVTAQRQLQKQLLQAQKMEVTAQLAGGVADRFNRLIDVIEGEANSLVQYCQDPQAAEPLKRIAATAGCTAGLTRQLLALVGRHPMQFQALDLNELIETQIPKVARLLGQKILLEKMWWTNPPSIMADPALVEQILHILVLNARDAMPNGGTLALSTAAVRVDEAHAERHEEARPGAFVCLSVSDTGCGMTPEVQARLFEPFFTTKESGKATGLGLASVHGLVKQHGGWLEVSTQAGAGSRFTVFFPCGPSPAPAKRLVSAPAATVSAVEDEVRSF
ncbi:MAG TPA: ATP-binding protein [Candidatus Binatia bacterium]|jgi:two-component system cell cycle sensor histidine kinase/response regulator CckA|nr:ATP-binding protein [Candidatus Binatia bacterium]